jgi:hypothetical protein
VQTDRKGNGNKDFKSKPKSSKICTQRPKPNRSAFPKGRATKDGRKMKRYLVLNFPAFRNGKDSLKIT